MANRLPVKAKDVVLLAWKTDDYYPFACAESGELVVDSEMMSTVTPSSGAWATSMPAGITGWRMQLNMVTVLRDLVDTMWFSWETLLESVRKNRILLRWKMTDTGGYEKWAQGYAWIRSTGISFNMNEGFGSSSVEFLGDSYLDLSSLITPNNPKQMRLEWTTTGSENGELSHASLIGVIKSKVMQVSVMGDDKYKITDSGTPVEGYECKLDGVAGKFIFTISAGQFDAGLYVYAIIDV